MFKVCQVEASIGVNSGGHGGKKAPSALDQLCLLTRRRLKACGLHVGAQKKLARRRDGQRVAGFGVGGVSGVVGVAGVAVGIEAQRRGKGIGEARVTRICRFGSMNLRRLPRKKAQGLYGGKARLRVFKGEEAAVRRAALQKLLECVAIELRLADEQLFSYQIQVHRRILVCQNQPLRADTLVQRRFHLQP